MKIKPRDRVLIEGKEHIVLCSNNSWLTCIAIDKRKTVEMILDNKIKIRNSQVTLKEEK